MTDQLLKARATNGFLRVSGRDRIDLLHRLSTNDLLPLKNGGRLTTTIFTTNQGRVIDWSTIVSREDDLLVVTSEGRASDVAKWIDQYTIMEDVNVEDLSDQWSSIFFQGPGAAQAMGVDVPDYETVVPHDDGVVHLGLKAFAERIVGYFPNAVADRIFSEVEGAEIGEVAQEVMRIEAGVPSVQHEYAKEVSPLELRLKFAINWHKGCYVGQEVISRLDSYDKIARYLMGFTGEGTTQAVEGKLKRAGKTIGKITSMLSDQGRVLGLAIVEREAAQTPDAVLEIESAQIDVALTDCPFWNTPADS